MLLSSCALWSAGSDPRGTEYKARASVVLASLREYQQAHGSLPQSLSALVPRYLASLPPEPELTLDVRNRLLSFVYSPSWPSPGRVSCAATIDSQEWSCHGYL